jgi:phage shock protein C
MATKKKTNSGEKKTNPQEKKFSSQHKRLVRSKNNKVLAGVAGGIGEYFQIDPTIIRLIFILLTIFGGSGLLIYIIFWLIMPLADSQTNNVQATIKSNVDEMSDRAKTIAQDLRFSSDREDSKFWWGLIIIIFGFLLLFNNFGLFNFFNFGKIWPVALVVVGILILLKRRQ